MLIGAAAFVGVLFATNAGIILWMLATGNDFRPQDAGDAFEKLALVAQYANERLAAAANNTRFPPLPELLADQRSIQVGLIATMFSQVAIFAIVGILSRQSFRELWRTFGMNRFSWRRLWVPVGTVFVAYVVTFLWIIAMEAIGVDLLIPQSTVPVEITRDDLTLSIAAAATVVGAPISEELFFRGFLFAGLLRWGFWPAAAISGMAFSVVHFDPGSLVPFFFLGVAMAWLYWRRGSLWDAIVFHFLFNFTSFTLLLVGT
ncbi:MAG TPA: type II CAAX endopeptidase family protein [Tepidiformaceae bacterium]|nr:type II CAAX endopeptidase family protein [Tepidiformaceae bacterium]